MSPATGNQADDAIETEADGGAGNDKCAVHQTGERFQARHRLQFTGLQRDGGAVHGVSSSESEDGNG
jgi:hypothetical protein